MYGTSDAEAKLEEHDSTKLADHGFLPGLAFPCVMYHPNGKLAWWYMAMSLLPWAPTKRSIWCSI